MPNLPMPEGLGTPDLECVMLDLASLPVRDVFGNDFDPDDLFYGDIPELKYAQGAVGEEKAHVTLLFGIHPSRSYRRNVDSVLKGWKPEPVTLNEVSFFPSSIEGQDYNVIIAKVAKTPNILEARARLAVLDYTDKFPEYKPHVTLAYIKGTARLDTWITRMDEAFGHQTFEPTGLNYGDD